MISRPIRCVTAFQIDSWSANTSSTVACVNSQAACFELAFELAAPPNRALPLHSLERHFFLANDTVKRVAMRGEEQPRHDFMIGERLQRWSATSGPGTGPPT